MVSIGFNAVVVGLVVVVEERVRLRDAGGENNYVFGNGLRFAGDAAEGLKIVWDGYFLTAWVADVDDRRQAIAADIIKVFPLRSPPLSSATHHFEKCARF